MVLFIIYISSPILIHYYHQQDIVASVVRFSYVHLVIYPLLIVVTAVQY